MSAIITPGLGGLLVIETLAAQLEKAASVDEIKDVRDRAMAIQLYARKKAGGLQAAQAAGRVVTDATLRLAELYAQEKPKPPGPVPKIVDAEQRSLVGQKAVATAASMDPAALSRLRPVVEAPKAQVKAAMTAIEARGEVVTPSALLREVTAVSAADDYDGDEWYTPANIIAATRTALGEIDLDPASNAHAQRTVGALRYLSKRDNGLTAPWAGRVFCNPPYSTPLIDQFTAKLIEEYDSRRCTAAVYLVNNCTDTGWFHSLLTRFAVCFTRGRIGFLDRRGQRFATRQGQAIFYLGTRPGAFRDAFAAIGVTVSHVA